jgi:hypothetical protein
MKTVFKVGDKVFDMNHGWGVVNMIYSEGLYPIFVKFMVSIQCYTLDGRLYPLYPKTLSFTEYTLHGFSQERPVVLPEVGEPVIVKGMVMYFQKYKDGEYYCSVTEDPSIQSFLHKFKQCKRFKFIEE